MYNILRNIKTTPKRMHSSCNVTEKRTARRKDVSFGGPFWQITRSTVNKFKEFRCHVDFRSFDCALTKCLLNRNGFAQSKIGQLDQSIRAGMLADENVARFNVAVNTLASVNVLQSASNLKKNSGIRRHRPIKLFRIAVWQVKVIQ